MPNMASGAAFPTTVQATLIVLRQIRETVVGIHAADVEGVQCVVTLETMHWLSVPQPIFQITRRTSFLTASEPEIG